MKLGKELKNGNNNKTNNRFLCNNNMHIPIY